jgi:hypothetical protein
MTTIFWFLSWNNVEFLAECKQGYLEDQQMKVTGFSKSKALPKAQRNNLNLAYPVFSL